MVRGDVNLDGKVSLKDVTLLRFFLLKATTLTDAQLQRGDMDASGAITLKDVSLIRDILLELEEPDEPDTSGSSDSSGGSSAPDASSGGPTVSTGSGWIGGDF